MRNRIPIVLATLALAGCDSGAPDEQAAAQPTPGEPAPAQTAREPASIIRDDIEVVREAPPLAPLDARIGFPEGAAELAPSARAELATLLASPQVAAGGRIVLRGHSDSAGSDEANLRASRARAEAVRDWLVENGVDETRIVIIAIGEQNPIRPNALPDGSANEAGRAANRRVDITVEVPDKAPPARQVEKPETLVGELTRPAD